METQTEMECLMVGRFHWDFQPKNSSDATADPDNDGLIQFI